MSLAQIADIQRARDPNVFKIVLQSRNPQAVRRSGGLHEVAVRAASKAECEEYANGLGALLNVPMPPAADNW